MSKAVNSTRLRISLTADSTSAAHARPSETVIHSPKTSARPAAHNKADAADVSAPSAPPQRRVASLDQTMSPRTAKGKGKGKAAKGNCTSPGAALVASLDAGPLRRSTRRQVSFSHLPAALSCHGEQEILPACMHGSLCLLMQASSWNLPSFSSRFIYLHRSAVMTKVCTSLLATVKLAVAAEQRQHQSSLR